MNLVPYSIHSMDHSANSIFSKRRWLLTREGLTLLAILLCALLLRSGYLTECSQAPDFEHPAIDAGYHDYWARTIAFSDAERPADMANPRIESSPFFRPPGYPYFLAGVYAAFGGGYLAPRIANLVLGLLSVVLVYAAGRRLFGHRSGAVAALWMALSSTLIYFEGELHAETLLIPLMLGVFLIALGLKRSLTIKRAFACGVLLGISALVRSNILLLAPLLMMWSWWVNRPVRPGFRLLSTAVAFVLGITLAISPASLRNLAVTGEFVPISSNLGVNLFMGNNPEAQPFVGTAIPGLGSFATCYDYPNLVASLERKLGRPMTHSEVSRYFTAEAVTWMADRPADFLKLTFEKALFFWGPREISHNKVVALELQNSRVLSALPYSFSLLLAAALWGLVAWAVRRRTAPPADGDRPPGTDRGSEVVLLVLWIGCWFLSILPFFVASRYRLPLVPLLALPAGFGLVSWFEAIVSKRFKVAVIATASLGGLWLLTSLHSDVGAPDRIKWHFDRAWAFNWGDEVDQAIVEFETILELEPRFTRAHYGLGYSLLLKGAPDEALPHFQEALRLEPQNCGALHKAGSILEYQGRLAEAASYFQRRVEVEPSSAQALKPLARVLIAMGDYAEALSHLQEAMRRDPQRPVHARDLAWLLATCPDPELRDGARAVRLAKDASRACEDQRWDLLEVLAAAYAETGRFEGARRTARRALELAPQAVREAGKLARLQKALAGYRDARPFRE